MEELNFIRENARILFINKDNKNIGPLNLQLHKSLYDEILNSQIDDKNTIKKISNFIGIKIKKIIYLKLF